MTETNMCIGQERSAATEEEWLRRRQLGIGASDAAVVLGVSSWKSAYQLWAEKVGLLEAEDFSDREPIEWGHRLQEPIRLAFSERTDRKTEPWPEWTIAVHRDRPWMICTPDAIQHADNGKGPGLLQIKTTSAYHARDWDPEPPLAYQVQLQHEIEVMDMAWGTLAVLIGGQRLRPFDMDRNPNFISAMVDVESAFWEKVEHRIEPPIDYRSPHTAGILAKLHPADSGESVVLPDEAAKWDTELVNTKRMIAELEADKAKLENRLKAALGDNTYGILPDGGRFSWKTQTSKAYQVAEKTFRVLRRLK